MTTRFTEEERIARRAKKIKRAEDVYAIAKDMSEEKAKELISDEELMPKLPVPYFLPPNMSENSAMELFENIRKSMAAEKILDNKLERDDNGQP